MLKQSLWLLALLPIALWLQGILGLDSRGDGAFYVALQQKDVARAKAHREAVNRMEALMTDFDENAPYYEFCVALEAKELQHPSEDTIYWEGLARDDDEACILAMEEHQLAYNPYIDAYVVDRFRLSG